MTITITESRTRAGTVWTEDALCAQTDAEIFFDPTPEGAKTAKSICQRCPVFDQCEDFALETDARFGIWAGKNPNELRKLKQKRARLQSL